jgi:hypothetical protein
MKWQITLFTIISAVAITAFAATAKKQSTFEVYGPEVLSTTASDGIVAAARNDVHELLAHWIPTPDGHRSDPSFREGSRSWTTTNKTAKTPTTAVGRAKTEFTDADGKKIVIEVIAGKDMPTLVFFSHEGAKDAMSLINTFTASLQKKGVRLNDE